MTPADRERLAEIRRWRSDDPTVLFLLRLLDARAAPTPASAMENEAEALAEALLGRAAMREIDTAKIAAALSRARAEGYRSGQEAMRAASKATCRDAARTELHGSPDYKQGWLGGTRACELQIDVLPLDEPPRDG